MDVPANAAQDDAGNNNTAAAQLSRTYDGTAPAVGISSAAADPTNSSSFAVTITFGEDVTGFEVADITVGNGTAGDFSNDTSNRVWTASITPTADGEVTVDVPADAAQDSAGNNSTAAARFSCSQAPAWECNLEAPASCSNS